LGNQYNNTSSPPNRTDESALYYNDFFNNNQTCSGCVNIQDELYNLNAGIGSGPPTRQVQAAIQVAFTNYILFLQCTGQMTGSNGKPAPANSCAGVYCPPNYSK
jgi:hypothetical protein